MKGTERVIRSAVVTGSTGAVGTALCGLLLNEGIEVFAVIRPGSKRMTQIPTGAKIVSCGLDKLSALPEMIPHADAFFHLGWAYTTGAGRNDMAAQCENIRASISAAECAEKLGASVFLGAGSQAEYGRCIGLLRGDTPCFPETGYGMAKLCAGEMTRAICRQKGISHIWARILSVYGPGDGRSSLISTLIAALLSGEKPALTEGVQLWDYLYSEDCARALLALAKCGRDGEVYPLGSGEARPLREYIFAVRDAIDPEIPLGFGEIPYGTGAVMHLEADISALLEDTGYRPETPFSEGIRKTVLRWREEHHE